MAFNEYPYTDFHEMNLDWVIKKVKELAAAWAQVQQDWTDEQAAFANLQSWIENYFNNLDVQTEINVKLDAMVAAGTMSELIAPYVASGLPAEVADQIGAVVAAQIGPVVAAQIGAVVADQLPAVAAAAAATEVSAWLAAHVNPDTGYVIDDTFTVQGAAADAKAVGDEFTAIKSALTSIAPSQIDSVANIKDFIGNGVTIIDGKYVASYDQDTNTWIYTDNAGYYLIKIDTSVINKTLVTSDYSWQANPNFSLAFCETSDGKKVGGNLLSNSAHNQQYLHVSSNNGVLTWSISDLLLSYPTARYAYIGMMHSHEYKWYYDIAFKELNWLKFNNNQIEQMKASLAEIPEIILPNKIIVVQGHQFNLYEHNFIIGKNIDNYRIVYTTSDTALRNCSKHYEGFVSINPTTSTTAGTYTLTVSLYDALDITKLIVQKSVSVKVIADTSLSNKKVMFIGDSLTYAKVYPAEIQANLSNNGIESVGTISGNVIINGVTISVKHEGRSGWSAEAYCTMASYNGASNAFWNPSTEKFDFSYYMTQNPSVSVPDVVCINLGTNAANRFGYENNITYTDEMIASILDYNSSIKILVSLIPPSATQDGFGASNTIGNGDTWNFDFYQRIVNSDYMTEYMNKANTDVVPVYLILDTKHDYPYAEVAVSARNPYIVERQTDKVHPSIYGYLHLADAYYNKLLDVLS